MFENIIDNVIEIVFPILFLIALLFFIVGMPIAIYKSSCESARIYNQQNGTNYTCSDFLWASEQINSQTQTIKLK